MRLVTRTLELYSGSSIVDKSLMDGIADACISNMTGPHNMDAEESIESSSAILLTLHPGKSSPSCAHLLDLQLAHSDGHTIWCRALRDSVGETTIAYPDRSVDRDARAILSAATIRRPCFLALAIVRRFLIIHASFNPDTCLFW